MKGLAAAALVAMVAGCASTPEPESSQATHYWESSKQASESRYRIDNLACQTAVDADQGSAMFELNSESFDAYRECMISRGYALRQY